MWVDRWVGRQVERQTDGADGQGGWDVSVHGGTWRVGAMYQVEQRHGRSNVSHADRMGGCDRDGGGQVSVGRWREQWQWAMAVAEGEGEGQVSVSGWQGGGMYPGWHG